MQKILLKARSVTFIVFALSVFLPTLLWAETPAGVTTPTVALSEQDKLQQVQQQLEEKKQKLLEAKQKEQESLNKLVVITHQLKQTQQELSAAKTRIVVNESKLKQLSTDIKQTETELSEKAKTLHSKVREIYKGSNVNYLELVLSSKSMGDFLSRSFYFGRVLEQDSNLITQINTEWKGQLQKKVVLKNVTQTIRQSAQEIQDKQESISTLAEEEKKVYDSLKQRREEYEKQVAELEESSKQLEKLITQKIAERAKSGIAAPVGTGRFNWPLGGRITSVFGYRKSPFARGRASFHTGVDIAAPYGTQVQASDGGEVIFTGWWDGYGKAVVLDHGKGFSTVYGHLSRIFVQVGQKIAQGQVIAAEGSTGYSTGPHCHFEIRINGKPVDPMPYLR